MQGPPLTRRKFLKAAGAASAVLLGSAALGCIDRTADNLLPTGSPSNRTYTIAGEVKAAFANYVPLPVTVTPSVASYSVPSDLSGVAYLESAGLDAAGRALLAKNLFCARPSTDDQVYDVYKRCKEAGQPVFVTTDAVLHAYHILFDFTLRRAEVDKLLPAVTELTGLMLDEALAQLAACPAELKDLCTANVAFFAVAQSMLGGSTGAVPSTARDLANAELALIDAHGGFATSPVFGIVEDYSQYVPRGHYTRSEDLKKYFKAMMWYGRMPFYLYLQGRNDRTPDKAHTRQAILVTLALSGKGRAMDLWKLVYDPTVFFVGETDDLSVYDYQSLIREVYGETVSLSDLADDGHVLAFIEKAGALRPPKIESTLVMEGEPSDITKGFRFMGQRFIPDSYMFQNLVSDKVPDRGFPMGLDVMAVLGSARAYAILAGLGETKYDGYQEHFGALKAEFAGLKADTWAQNLYWNWLYCLLALLDPKGDGYPTFMRNDAWIDKDLNASMGSWTELRHDTILYAKQSYARLTAMPMEKDARGYVEPDPELYGRLASLAQMTYDGLTARDLLNDEFGTKLEGLRTLLLKLKGIAEKELASTTLTDDDYRDIRNVGDTLESLTTFTPETAGSISSDADKQMAVIADVHTDSNSGQVLEEAVGDPAHVFVIVPIDGKLTLTQGAIFSYYEFKQPMSDRLTDEAWQAKLDAGTQGKP
ncbi:MAG TPA: DUF3160 domain-containing protein, partial [Methanocella sp.]|nr:DUF3160 domain-containing protein [Methanocella sp.]